MSVFFLPLKYCHCDEYVEEVLTVIISKIIELQVSTLQTISCMKIIKIENKMALMKNIVVSHNHMGFS